MTEPKAVKAWVEIALQAQFKSRGWNTTPRALKAHRASIKAALAAVIPLIREDTHEHIADLRECLNLTRAERDRYREALERADRVVEIARYVAKWGCTAANMKSLRDIVKQHDRARKALKGDTAQASEEGE